VFDLCICTDTTLDPRETATVTSALLHQTPTPTPTPTPPEYITTVFDLVVWLPVNDTRIKTIVASIFRSSVDDVNVWSIGGTTGPLGAVLLQDTLRVSVLHDLRPVPDIVLVTRNILSQLDTGMLPGIPRF